MANRFNFRSPGAAAGSAIEQFLAERELEKQRKLMAEIALAERQREHQLRTAQEARVASDSQRNFEALERERESERARAIVEMAGELEEISPDTEGLLERTGFGGRIQRRGSDKYTPISASGGADDPLNPPEPAKFVQGIIRPGFRYEQAREAAEERAAMASDAQKAAVERARDAAIARAEQADKDRQLRRDLGGLAASNRNANADLQRDLLQGRVDAAQDKAKEAADDRTRKSTAVINAAQETMEVIGQLLDNKTNKLLPGAASLYGKSFGGRFVPGSEAANADAALRQLVSKSVVNLISEMKSQSRTGATGFGALSERELQILLDATNKLNNRWMSDEAAEDELVRVYRKIQDIKMSAEREANKVRGRQSTGSQPPAQAQPTQNNPYR